MYQYCGVIHFLIQSAFHCGCFIFRVHAHTGHNYCNSPGPVPPDKAMEEQEIQ